MLHLLICNMWNSTVSCPACLMAGTRGFVGQLSPRWWFSVFKMELVIQTDGPKRVILAPRLLLLLQQYNLVYERVNEFPHRKHAEKQKGMLSDLQHTSHWKFVCLVLGYLQFIPTLWHSGFDSFAKMSNFMAMTRTVQSQSFALITTGSMKSHKNQTFPPQLELKETIKNSPKMMFVMVFYVTTESLYSRWKGENIVHTCFVVDTSKKRFAERRMWGRFARWRSSWVDYCRATRSRGK